MLPSLPSKPVSSILRQDSTTQIKSLKGILKDVQEHNKGLDRNAQMRVAKTLHQLNEDPSKVISKSLKKEALRALRDAGDLRSRYTKNLGAAMKDLNKEATSMQHKTFTELKDMRASEMSKEERKRLKMYQNKMRARAVEAREEAEGSFHAGNHETTRFGLEAWQNSSVSANSSQRRQSGYTLQSGGEKSKKNSSTSKPPMIEMMID
jgi:hypothetical protein